MTKAEKALLVRYRKYEIGLNEDGNFILGNNAYSASMLIRTLRASGDDIQGLTRLVVALDNIVSHGQGLLAEILG